jgi:signal transduction histidine kinase
MKLSISNKYAAAFGIVSLAVTALITASFIALLDKSGNEVRTQIEMTEREIYEESQGKTQLNLARYLSRYLFAPLYRLDIDALNRLIRDMKQALSITSFLITDPRGKVLTDGSSENFSYGRQINVSRLKTDFLEETDPEGRRITFAIKAGDHVAGYGQIIFSSEPLETALKRQRESLSSTWNSFSSDFWHVALIFFSIVILFAALLSYLFSRTLSRPLIMLRNATDRVARGDLDYQVIIRSDDEIGQLAGSFNRMVQDLKTSTDRLKDANEKLRELDRLKSEFISIVSHELRTPITSVKAFAELILMKPSLSPHKQTKFLEIIRGESERLARLINDILDLTKIETGKLQWHMRQISLEEVVRHSVASIEPLAHEKGVSITVTVERNLPLLYGDSDRLIQVAVNILSNSVKFTPEGGSIHVDVHREQGPLEVLAVSISDTGIGIPEKSLHAIFDKFQRAGDDLTIAVEGTGLGLAIARQIVQHHGGEICAMSRRGEGATFIFMLPLGDR